MIKKLSKKLIITSFLALGLLTQTQSVSAFAPGSSVSPIIHAGAAIQHALNINKQSSTNLSFSGLSLFSGISEISKMISDTSLFSNFLNIGGKPLEHWTLNGNKKQRVNVVGNVLTTSLNLSAGNTSGDSDICVDGYGRLKVCDKAAYAWDIDPNWSTCSTGTAASCTGDYTFSSTTSGSCGVNGETYIINKDGCTGDNYYPNQTKTCTAHHSYVKIDFNGNDFDWLSVHRDQLSVPQVGVHGINTNPYYTEDLHHWDNYGGRALYGYCSYNIRYYVFCGDETNKTTCYWYKDDIDYRLIPGSNYGSDDECDARGVDTTKLGPAYRYINGGSAATQTFCKNLSNTQCKSEPNCYLETDYGTAHRCTEITEEQRCDEEQGCDWLNNSSAQSCSTLSTESSCKDKSCTWTPGMETKSCTGAITETSCTSQNTDCIWTPAGISVKTRSVTCIDQTGSVVDDSNCEAVAGEKPPTESTEGCVVEEPNETYFWDEGNWSSCVATSAGSCTGKYFEEHGKCQSQINNNAKIDWTGRPFDWDSSVSYNRGWTTWSGSSGGMSLDCGLNSRRYYVERHSENWNWYVEIVSAYDEDGQCEMLDITTPHYLGPAYGEVQNSNICSTMDTKSECNLHAKDSCEWISISNLEKKCSELSSSVCETKIGCILSQGTGEQTKSVTCRRDSDKKIVDDSYCPGTKPPTKQACTSEKTVDNTSDWDKGDWSFCKTTKDSTCTGSYTEMVTKDWNTCGTEYYASLSQIYEGKDPFVKSTFDSTFVYSPNSAAFFNGSVALRKEVEKRYGISASGNFTNAHFNGRKKKEIEFQNFSHERGVKTDADCFLAFKEFCKSKNMKMEYSTNYVPYHGCTRLDTFYVEGKKYSVRQVFSTSASPFISFWKKKKKVEEKKYCSDLSLSVCETKTGCQKTKPTGTKTRTVICPTGKTCPGTKPATKQACTPTNTSVKPSEVPSMLSLCDECSFTSQCPINTSCTGTPKRCRPTNTWCSGENANSCGINGVVPVCPE